MQSKEVVIEHNYTHSPYRSWCPFCVAGKRDDVAHGEVKEPMETPVVAMDYAFTGKEGKPIIVRYDEEDKMMMARRVPRKGNLINVAQRIAKRLERLGRPKLILKFD